jgi:lipid-A-disaccharide synthase
MVARVATPFEWSATKLAAAGCRADWVGHPLLESKSGPGSRELLRREFGVEPNEKLVALLPGSRVSEIRVLSPRLAAAARILARERPMKFIVPVPAPLVQKARAYFPPDIKILVGRATDVLLACDAAVVKTGSATLEAAVAGAPQVTVYDLGWTARIEWLLLWMWKRIPFIAMPNIILQRMLVPELLGLNCRPEAIAAGVSRLLRSDEDRRLMEAGYGEIRTHLGGNLPHGATERTVEILEEMLGEPVINAGMASSGTAFVPSLNPAADKGLPQNSTQASRP